MLTLKHPIILTEGKVSKGGRNPPNTSLERPPAPGSSLGTLERKHYEAIPILVQFAIAMEHSPHKEVKEAATKALSEWDKQRGRYRSD